MIAASARRSGTRAPFSSVLKRGVCASLSARACAATLAALAFARRARRAAAVDLAGAFAFFLAGRVSLPVFDPVGAAVDCRLLDAFGVAVVWASVADGSATTAETARAQNSRAFLNRRVRITGNPLQNNLLWMMSALYQE